MFNIVLEVRNLKWVSLNQNCQVCLYSFLEATRENLFWDIFVVFGSFCLFDSSSFWKLSTFLGSWPYSLFKASHIVFSNMSLTLTFDPTSLFHLQRPLWLQETTWIIRNSLPISRSADYQPYFYSHTPPLPCKYHTHRFWGFECSYRSVYHSVSLDYHNNSMRGYK